MIAASSKCTYTPYAYVPTRLTHLHAYISTHLHIYLHPYMPTYLHTYMPDIYTPQCWTNQVMYNPQILGWVN